VRLFGDGGCSDVDGSLDLDCPGDEESDGDESMDDDSLGSLCRDYPSDEDSEGCESMDEVILGSLDEEREDEAPQASNNALPLAKPLDESMNPLKDKNERIEARSALQEKQDDNFTFSGLLLVSYSRAVRRTTGCEEL